MLHLLLPRSSQLIVCCTALGGYLVGWFVKLRIVAYCCTIGRTARPTTASNFLACIGCMCMSNTMVHRACIHYPVICLCLLKTRCRLKPAAVGTAVTINIYKLTT